jgi:hypothetical protein
VGHIFSGQPKTTKTHIRKIKKEPEEEEEGGKTKQKTFQTRDRRHANKVIDHLPAYSLR